MLFRPDEHETKTANADRDMLIRLIGSLERRGSGPADHEFWVIPDKIVGEIEAHLNAARAGQA